MNLDNTLDEWLSEQVNQNKTVRDALYLYKGDISTSVNMENLIKSYRALINYIQPKFESYDESFDKLNKLLEQIESSRNFG